jgi:hypothetical protein
MSAHPAEGNAPLTIQALTDLLGAEVVEMVPTEAIRYATFFLSFRG